MEDTDLLQSEQFAAIVTRLGAQKLQEASRVTATKFCAEFGIGQTEEIERLVLDPAMMEPQRRCEVRRELQSAFELKQSLQATMQARTAALLIPYLLRLMMDSQLRNLKCLLGILLYLEILR